MPTVENVAAGQYYHRETGHLSAGDTENVPEELAAYLVEKRGDFAYVDDGITDVEYEEVDDNAVAEGPYRDRDAVEASDCGYVDPETGNDPCSRDAGWGRDADDGPCKDHVDALE